MITRKKFMKFCDNHKIKYNDDAVTKASHYFVKYKDVKDPDLDKSFYYPSYTFFYINFKKKEYDETFYLYKPFEKLYDSTKPDEYGWYSYESYGDIYVSEPIHCYEENDFKTLFTTKNFSKKDVIKTTVPFNTLDQLEHLYNKLNQFSKDVKDFYYSESFQQAVQTYKNNIKMAKELKTANKDLVSKTLQITKRKHDLSEDFIF